MSSSPERVWLDEEEPESDWSPPAEAPPGPWAPPPDPSPDPSTDPAERRRTVTWLAVGVGGLSLLLLLLWAVGGFGPRTDRAIPVPPGTSISTGPYELSFARATAQQSERFDGEVQWEIKVIGSGRTTAETSSEPSIAGNTSMFAARDGVSPEALDPTGLLWGTDERISEGNAFTPGLPPQPLTVVFEFPEAYRPADILQFAVLELDFRDNSLFGDQDPQWRLGVHYWAMSLPLTRLPDQLN